MFKFVINIPLKINAVPSHFNPSILSINHLTVKAEVSLDINVMNEL